MTKQSSTHKIRLAAHLAVALGQDVNACTYPAGSDEHKAWLDACLRAKFEEECT